jgi:hypothetical protein
MCESVQNTTIKLRVIGTIVFEYLGMATIAAQVEELGISEPQRSSFAILFRWAFLGHKAFIEVKAAVTHI